MRTLILAAGLSAIAAGAYANELPVEHVTTLACLENMETSTTWSQCVGLIFEPCVSYDVGSEDHIGCLQIQRKEWRASMEILQSDVQNAITLTAAGELSEILGGWVNYVSQKCQAAGETNAATSADAARLGCQITEITGLAGEYAACLEGRSTAEFCVLKQ